MYNAYAHVTTGTRYVWVDVSTWSTGFVQVCTPAHSIYLVRTENLVKTR
jgi:hypothetical protein